MKKGERCIMSVCCLCCHEISNIKYKGKDLQKHPSESLIHLLANQSELFRQRLDSWTVSHWSHSQPMQSNVLACMHVNAQARELRSAMQPMGANI